MGVPSAFLRKAPAQESLALTREMLQWKTPRQQPEPPAKPRDEPAEGHSMSTAGCSYVCSPFPAFSWHYWDDFGLAASLLSVFWLLREQLSLLDARSSGMSTSGTG